MTKASPAVAALEAGMELVERGGFELDAVAALEPQKICKLLEPGPKTRA